MKVTAMTALVKVRQNLKKDWSPLSMTRTLGRRCLSFLVGWAVIRVKVKKIVDSQVLMIRLTYCGLKCGQRSREGQGDWSFARKMGDENVQLGLKACTRKKPIWQEISDFLMVCGYQDRDGEACKSRLHTLVMAYRQYKDELKKTGNATHKKPPFFDELDKILSDKPSTQPKVVINSTKIVTALSCEDESENIEIIPKGSSNSSSIASGKRTQA